MAHYSSFLAKTLEMAMFHLILYLQRKHTQILAVRSLTSAQVKPLPNLQEVDDFQTEEQHTENRNHF